MPVKGCLPEAAQSMTAQCQAEFTGAQVYFPNTCVRLRPRWCPLSTTSLKPTFHDERNNLPHGSSGNASCNCSSSKMPTSGAARYDAAATKVATAAKVQSSKAATTIKVHSRQSSNSNQICQPGSIGQSSRTASRNTCMQ